jgi:pimeloyl-ACP methyl ester carboxylesterase
LESAHLVATSFGGYFALHAAATHPDRIDRMVQFSWPIGAPTTHLPAIMRVTSIPGLGRMMASLPPTERRVRMIFRSLGHRASLEAGRITQDDTDSLRNEIAPGRALMSPIKGLNDRLTLSDSLLAKVVAPTYFLWGEKDPFGNAETARQLVDRIPNAELEMMPGVGHAPWLDDLDHCIETVSRFLSK